MLELHWSNDTPVTPTLCNSFNCAKLLPGCYPETGYTTFPACYLFLTLIYCFFVFWGFWLFDYFFFDRFLILFLKYQKPGLSWGSAHPRRGTYCKAGLRTERIHCKAGCSLSPMCQNGNPRQVRSLGVKPM